MKKIIYFCLIYLLCITAKVYAKEQKKVLKVGVSATWPPFEYVENGKIIGFDIDLANRIGEIIGRKIEFEDMTLSTLIFALNSGKIDTIISGLTITDERKKSVDFTQSYFDNRLVLVVQNKNNEKFTSLDQLKGRKVGVELGSTADDIVSTIKEIKNEKFDNPSMAIVALKNGKLDAVVIDETPAEKNVASIGGVKIVKNFIVATEELGIAVNKGDTKLLKQINNALTQLKKSGEMDTMKKKWFK